MEPPPTTAAAVHRRAVVWLIAGTAAWGLSFPVQKMLAMIQQARVPDADSWFLTSWIICLRALIASAVLLAWRPALLRGLTRNEVVQGVWLGAFGGLGLILQADGLAHTAASTSAFLTQAYCILLPFWHCLTRRRPPHWRLLASTAMVVWGIAILARVDWRTFHMGRGEWETLAASAAFAAQIVLLERPRYRMNRPLPVTVVMFLGFALWSLPVAIAAAPRPADLITAIATPAAAGHLAILALVSTAFAYVVMNTWQPNVSAAEAGLIYCMEPVCAALFALFLPALLSAATGVPYANESLTLRLLAGGGLITLANALLQGGPTDHSPDPGALAAPAGRQG